MVMAYLFSIVGFLYFRADFDADGVAEGAEATCETLPRCFVHILTTGIRNGGGVGDVMNKKTWADESFGPRTVFDFCFWVVMIIIFLNILFGIILDTFASLRDDRNKKEEDMKSICFICGLEASSLERQGIQFSVHCLNEHNVWHYLYFMHHLKRKDKDNYTGQESYVCEKLSEKDINFFPSGMCLSLHTKNEDAGKSDETEGKKEGRAGNGEFLFNEETEEAISATVRDAVTAAMATATGGPTVSTPLLLSSRHGAIRTPRDTTTARDGAGSPRKAAAGVTAALHDTVQRLTAENQELHQEIARLREGRRAQPHGNHAADGNSQDLLAEIGDLARECAKLCEGNAITTLRESTQEMAFMVRSMTAK
jgi:NTP pyrophosphatase (non-canonical NTP hydrolase)